MISPLSLSLSLSLSLHDCISCDGTCILFSKRIHFSLLIFQIVGATPNDLQDYTYYFIPAPWLTVKLMRLLQCFDIPGNVYLNFELCTPLEV